MNLTSISSLARPVNLSFSTNRAIAIIAGLSLIGFSAYQLFLGANWLDSLLSGGHLAITLFLTWAVARELDPDYPFSAFVALPLSLILFLYEPPSLLPVVALLLLLRMISRITGQPAKWIDSFVMLGFAAYLAWMQEYIISFGISIAFALDGWLVNPLKRHLYFAATSVLVTIGIILTWGIDFKMVSFPLPYAFALLNIPFLFVSISDYREPQSTTDDQSSQLTSSRVRSAQQLVFIVMLLAVFLEDEANVLNHAPFWAAVSGINLHFLYRWVRRLL